MFFYHVYNLWNEPLEYGENVVKSSLKFTFFVLIDAYVFLFSSNGIVFLVRIDNFYAHSDDKSIFLNLGG